MEYKLVYAKTDSCFSYDMHSDIPLTIKDAISKSEVLKENLELNINDLKVGVYSKELPLDHLLEDGDRVEIYRSLEISPIQARKLRAQQKRKNKNIKLFGA